MANRRPGPEAVTRVSPERWAAVRAAVGEGADRFATLVRTAPDPSAQATEHWSVAETAAHVTAIAWNNTALAGRGAVPLPIPEVRRYMPTTTVDNLHRHLNPTQLRAFGERDPARLADRLQSSVQDLLDRTAQADPAEAVDWLGGARLPLAGVFAHLMNELHIHGRDIAGGARLPWRIGEEQAALFFDLFVVEIVRHGYGILLDDDRPPQRGVVAVDFRSAHTAPVRLVLDHGHVRAEEPVGGADVVVRFRPAALNLMLFHRVSPLRTALSGGVLVSGRRPWLLPTFLRKVRMP